MMRCHLTWTSETESGVCPECGAKTILVTALGSWDVCVGPTNADCETVAPDVEVTGHFCEACYKIRSVAVNVGDG